MDAPRWIGGDWVAGADPQLAWRLPHLAPGAATLCSGRLALSRAIAAVTRPGQSVLLPALGCPALAQAARLADTRPVFYPADDQLAPRWAELPALARRAGARAAVLVHPAGWLLDRDAARRLARDGLTLIEDGSHTLMNAAGSVTLGPGVSAAVAASLRKVLPMPSGGAWRAWDQMAAAAAGAPEDAFTAGRMAAMVLPPGAERHRQLARLERLLDIAPPSGPLPPAAEAVLGWLAAAAPTRERRWRQRCRANWRVLAAHLAGSAARPVWRALPAGVCPLALVIRHPNRSHLARHLLAHGVEATLSWPAPAEARAAMDTGERVLAGTLLSLPCDARYDGQDMVRIADLCRGHDGRRT